MKKVLSLILALITAAGVLAATSCKSDDARQDPSDGTQTEHYEDYYNKYLFVKDGSLLYRVNTETAVATPVCPDPLCDHSDKSCIFYKLHDTVNNATFQVVGDCMYYVRGNNSIFGGDYWGQLCRFDLVTGEWDVLYDTKTASPEYFCVNEDFVFFTTKTVFVQEHESGAGFSAGDLCDVYRYDLKKNKLECLKKEAEDHLVWPLAAKDGRVYFVDYVSFDFFSTDENYENRIDGDQIDDTILNNPTRGKYSFVTESLGSTESHPDIFTRPLVCNRFTRVDMETGEETVIFDEVDSTPIVYDGYIIYSKYEPKFMGNYTDAEDGNLNPHYDTCGGKLYICDLNGENERLLLDKGDERCSVRDWTEGSVGIGPRGSGDWILARLRYYIVDDTADEVITTDRFERVLINVVTGATKEVRVVSAD